MRLNKLFLFGLAGLSLASCSKDNYEGNDPKDGKGGTYASLTIEVKKPLSRAVNQGDYTGSANENTVATLSYLQGSAVKDFTLLATAPQNVTEEAPQAEKFWYNATSQKYETGIWKTSATADPVPMALMINAGTKAKAAGNSADGTKTLSSTTAADDKALIAEVTTASKFLMTSKVPRNTILAKTFDDVKGGSNDATNNFQFDMERVVAKGIVYKTGNANFNLNVNGTKVGEIKADLKFAALNGARSTYVFAEKAGSRTVGDDGTYKDFESAVHTEAVPSDAISTDGSEKFIRLGNIAPYNKNDETKKTNDDLGAYKAIAVQTSTVTSATALGALDGIYFFENSFNAYNIENNAHGYRRYAYAKVYVTIVPTTLHEVELVNSATEGYTEFTRFVVGDADQYATYKYGRWKTGTISANADGTFYYSKSKGKFYKTYQSAAFDGCAQNDVFVYRGGKAAYRALWHRAEDGDHKVTNADVRRNNVYVLKIAGFEGMGMPYDPTDPNDPNLPKDDGGKGEGNGGDGGDNGNGGGGDTTPPGGDDNVEAKDAYMRVIATVLNWNVVMQDTTFKPY